MSSSLIAERNAQTKATQLHAKASPDFAAKLAETESLLRRAAAFGRFGRTELWSDVRFRAAHRLYLSEGFAPGPTRVLADPDRSVERYFSKEA